MGEQMVGAGWAFPPRVDATGAIALVRGERELTEAIRLILATSPGERSMRPEFGCAIHDYVFAPADAGTAGQLAYEVRLALDRWEPRIEVQDVSVRFDAVDDAERLVQQKCPEWTDHNVSDPGVTLIEAFATMVDQLLYRLNRVPDKHYLAFLDLIGVRRYPPTAATTDVTFRLSAPQPVPVPVAAGTEDATARDEIDEAVVFSTTKALSIVPCEFKNLATTPAAGGAADRADELTFGQDVPCFGSPPTPGDALCVGLSNPVPGCLVALRLTCRIEGVGVDPRDPPLAWEAWTGGDWTQCEVDSDGTGGLNRPGEVLLHVPDGHVVSAVAGRTGGWLRCRLVPTRSGQPGYLTTPTVREIVAFTIGGSVPAVHAETVLDEVLGMAEGVPAQRLWVSRPPVVATGEPIVVEVAGESGWDEWTVVDDF